MANTKKSQPVLTLDEHTKLGVELLQTRRRFEDLSVILAERYPERVGEAAHRVAQVIDNLRGVLDGILYREKRGEDRSNLHAVYYPAVPVAQKEP